VEKEAIEQVSGHRKNVMSDTGSTSTEDSRLLSSFEQPNTANTVVFSSLSLFRSFSLCSPGLLDVHPSPSLGSAGIRNSKQQTGYRSKVKGLKG
jgi:hypothetical protein